MRGFLLLYYAHPSVLARPSDNMLSSGRLGFYAFALLYRFFCACFSQGLFFRACRRCRILSHLCLLACVRSRAAVKRRARVLRVRRGYAVFCCYFWCFCAINESVCDFESTRDKGVGVQNPAVSRRDWASADSTEAHEVLSARLTRRAEREVLRAGSNTGISGVILYGSRQSRTCDLSFTRGSAHVAAAKKKGERCPHDCVPVTRAKDFLLRDSVCVSFNRARRAEFPSLTALSRARPRACLRTRLFCADLHKRLCACAVQWYNETRREPSRGVTLPPRHTV